jgi:hypothetical protein
MTSRNSSGAGKDYPEHILNVIITILFTPGGGSLYRDVHSWLGPKHPYSLPARTCPYMKIAPCRDCRIPSLRTIAVTWGRGNVLPYIQDHEQWLLTTPLGPGKGTLWAFHVRHALCLAYLPGWLGSPVWRDALPLCQSHG